MSRRKHLVLDVCIILGVLIAYVFSLLGYDWLAHTPGPLPQPDVGTTDDTVVLIRFEELHTVANRLDVKVLVLPDDSMIDHRLQVLTTDTSVRLYPENELGDLQYPVGKLPAQVATTIEAHGNPGAWPFDTYTTDTVQADVLVGADVPAFQRSGHFDPGGYVLTVVASAVRVGESSQTSDRPDNVIITLKRAKGPLVFDLGICLVLITLPTLALFVAIQMITGRRKFQPPFGTWYAAMLFAVVPLRTILPGSPPAGAWIDRAVVIWVLIALAAAMVVYIVAWYRESD